MQARANPAAGYYPVGIMAMALLLAGTLEPTPLFVLYRRSFGLTPAEISIVFAAYAGSLIPALLLLGGLSDTLGRRRTIVLSFGILILGALVFARADGLVLLIVARVVQGLAMGIGLGASASAIREWMPAGEVARAGFWTVMGAAGGSAAGALLGGAFGEYAPAPLVTPYLAYIALVAIATIFVVRVPASGLERAPFARRALAVPTAIRRPFLLASAQSFIGWAGFALFISLVPTFLAQSLGLHNLLVGALVVTGVQVGSTIGSIGAARLSNRVAILGAMAALGIGVWLLLLGVHVENYVLVVFATIVAGVGGGVSYLAGLNVVNAIAPPEQRAETISAYLVACYLGFSLPALGVGVAANLVGLFPAFLGAAVCLGVLAIAIMVMTTSANLRVASAE